MTSKKSSFELHLEKLRSEYKLQLPEKISAIKRDWQLLINIWNDELIIQLHRNVHSLIGTAGTFGFNDISKIARRLEELIKPLLAEKSESYIIPPELCSLVFDSIANIERLITTSAEKHH